MYITNESLWPNGKCKKVVETMRKLEERGKRKEIGLAWAIMARNSLEIR